MHKPSYKPLYRSMTVASALLMVGSFFAANYVQAAPQVTGGIMVLGSVAIAIYLRRSLTDLLEEVERLRQLVAASEGRPVQRRQVRTKPLVKTMTFRSAAAMVIAYVGAQAFKAPPVVVDGILVVGIALMAIFLRRAIIEVFREAD